MKKPLTTKISHKSGCKARPWNYTAAYQAKVDKYVRLGMVSPVSGQRGAADIS